MSTLRFLPWLASLLVSFAVVLPAVSLHAQTPENGVCAHRGASVEFPENSLQAFQRAIELGADWIETDVCHTADGVLVLNHDTGTGACASKNLEIAKTTYAELCKLDMAEKFRAAHHLTLDECPPLKICLLSDALDLILKYKKARLTLHMKANTLEGITKLVREKHAEAWIGFNGHESLLVPAREVFPDVPMFWDRYGSDVDQDIQLNQKLGFKTMVFFYKDVTSEKVAKVRAAGMEAGAWIVNGEADMRRLLEAGVTRFYTDDPALLLKVKADMRR